MTSKLTVAPAILIVGRNSFFARCFASACADLDIRHVAIDDLDRPDVYEGAGTVVSFAFDPRFYREAYDPMRDVDRRIAEKIAGRPVHYFLLSSRAVYGPAVKWGARENAETEGDGVYGENRVAVERAVTERVNPERLAILRISNTVAYELQPGRRETFMSLLLAALRDRGEVHFEMSPRTQRDFITDDFFCRTLRQLIEMRANGVWNVGCGYPVSTGDIAGWVIDGFGKGRIVSHSDEVRDAFYLDTTRLREFTGLAISPDALRDRCREIGRRLAGA